MENTPGLIETINERYEKRKAAKAKYDRMINLSNKTEDRQKKTKLASASKDNTVRLLDEGMVVMGEDWPAFYIKKGVLKNWYDNLSSDYVGTINLGHEDYATYPKILGTWTKEDLTLVDIGDGRNGLDVRLNLDEEVSDVQDIKRMQQKYDIPIGVSAEFYTETDWDATYMLGFQVISKVDIQDFAIVGEAGNVNSGGVKLKGESELDNKKTPMEKLLSMLGKEKTDGAKKDDTKTDEKELSGIKDMEDAVKVLANVMEDNEELRKLNAQYEEAAEKIAETVEATAAENETLKKELASLKEEKQDDAAKEKNVSDALARFQKLAAGYKKDKREYLNNDDHEDKKTGTEELSHDGFGRI